MFKNHFKPERIEEEVGEGDSDKKKKGRFYDYLFRKMPVKTYF